jgi:hypothetical protein
MNPKYPHIELLLDNVLRYPAEVNYGDTKSVLAEYLDRKINPDSANDPEAKLLQKELILLLQEWDDVFISITGNPGSQDWEFGVPELDKLKEVSAAYIKETDKNQS